MAVSTVLALSSAARATYTSGPITLPILNDLVLDLDINVTALTGGTSPTVKFTVSRIGADGVNYVLYNPTALSAAGTFMQSIGVGAQTNADPGASIQIDMVGGGTAPPTTVTFSLSLQARGF